MVANRTKATPIRENLGQRLKSSWHGVAPKQQIMLKLIHNLLDGKN
jgi:hypothetical protein